MTGLETRQAFDSTSAAGAMRRRPNRNPVLGLMLAGIGTSTTYAVPPDAGTWQRPVAQTTAGAAVEAAEPAGAAIGELRRLSGLTWEQLARLVSVSRRSLHFWASGKAMTPGNEEHLQRLLGVVRRIDRGAASVNRAVLLGTREDGTIPFDLLAARGYDRALSVIGSGESHRPSLPKLSSEARATRSPRPPEELAGALQDRIHPTSGRLRAAKAIVTSRRK
jgi:transcriptional regulator with XRE-family HTH domain